MKQSWKRFICLMVCEFFAAAFEFITLDVVHISGPTGSYEFPRGNKIEPKAKCSREERSRIPEARDPSWSSRVP